MTPIAMTPIDGKVLIPSAGYTLTPEVIGGWAPEPLGSPRVGDVIWARVVDIGHHVEVESRTGRVHQVLAPGWCGVFVMGNRYAPDAYEALIPDRLNPGDPIDLVARSGVAARVAHRNPTCVGAPTRLYYLGPVLDPNGEALNTLDHAVIDLRSQRPHPAPVPMTMVVGTAMNSGKSTTATGIARALISAGQRVVASKITGTASLKEILNVEDAGAEAVSDFTYLGYPTTYRIPPAQLLRIFTTLDHHIARDPGTHWIVEVADGVAQPETAVLLSDPTIQGRITNLVLCANQAFDALGALHELQHRHHLTPDLISGIITTSPLATNELQTRTPVPIIDPNQQPTQLTTHLTQQSPTPTRT